MNNTEYFNGKINELETNKTRIQKLYMWIQVNLRDVTSLELSKRPVRIVICLQISTVFCTGGRLISVC